MMDDAHAINECLSLAIREVAFLPGAAKALLAPAVRVLTLASVIVLTLASVIMNQHGGLRQEREQQVADIVRAYPTTIPCLEDEDSWR